MTTPTVERLHRAARRLDGRPQPGVRVSEREFDRAWWDEDVNAEWVGGQVVVMAPANGEHSDLNLWLLRLFAEFVDAHDLGTVRGPEFQVRLPAVRRRRNPDLIFVSKSSAKRLTPTYLEGPPDLVIEIVSPDSAARDWREKYTEYEASGVREYWIVDPGARRAEAYTLVRGKNQRYVRLPDADNKVHSKVLKGLYVRPTWLWSRPQSKLAEAAKELGLRR